MVLYNPKNWFGLIFKFHKGETFQKLIWVMLSIAIFSGIVVYVEIEVFELQFASTTLMHSILGFIISLLLVFRTNTAYDRWWEGRKHWGALVNVSRNLSLKINAFLPAEEKRMRQELQELVGGYAAVLKEHLRSHTRAEMEALLPAFLPISKDEVHFPNHMANGIQQRLLKMYQKDHISEAAYLAMLQDLNAFTDICGACERIKKTPIPYTYNIFIKKFIFAYIITMPFCFVETFGYGTIVVTVFTFYALASLELIAEEIEDPFGLDSNDLPTDQLSETIAANVQEILKK